VDSNSKVFRLIDAFLYLLLANIEIHWHN